MPEIHRPESIDPARKILVHRETLPPSAINSGRVSRFLNDTDTLNPTLAFQIDRRLYPCRSNLDIRQAAEKDFCLRTFETLGDNSFTPVGS